MANIQRGARAGAAAFALGLSLTWPVVAIASADGPDQGSSAASAGPAKPSSGTARSARTAGPAHDSATRAGTPSAAATGSARSSTSSVAGLRVRADAAADIARARTGRPQARASSPAPEAVAADPADSATDAQATTQPAQSQTPTLPAADTVAESPVTSTAARVTALRVPVGSSQASSLADVFTGLVGTVQGFLEGAVLLIRRSLFNEAPTVAPVQTSGQTAGPITGTIGATDPEGDQVVYTVRQQPRFGTVVVDSTGNYTYTPDAGFAGIDAFTVAATDTGPHINLLNWFRDPSTDAVVSVTQDASATPRITFNFIYGSGSQFWSSAARAELQSTAIYLSSYFVVANPVTLTYQVTGQYSLFGSTLASAGSDLISSDPGFYSTVVQNKILTGQDANGSAPDGVIDWNFGYSWAYGSSVGGGQYDFQSTATHELLHTFGFLSVVDSAGNNTYPNWTTFDSFIVTSAGTPAIGNDFVWKTAYNANLIGSNGGLYFGGPNAVAAYGGYVPLYTPNPWESGSSISHLDDNTFTGANQKMMNASSNTGLGVRTLSAVEIGILKDLGYTMVSPSPTSMLLFVGFVFLRRRKRR
ncbi:hypothetical protein BayCH28_27130 [Mycolicibacterium sp. CH28]|uniref:Ig-like domain-containing protein n=1 Tax=Mycolicibacterium sp. CH28 TaxID=2512237 RepID=UPI0010821C2B|nr:Ig-like domain-containing protein [Mycolicibacterium sp. CH28]TGD84099.1 hypothetical protein BayCH28_27130 [Mycolicibacterium sp. CH28]